MEREPASRAGFDFTESLIRQQASAESFKRGKQYHRAQMVVSLLRRGNIIQGEVEGSQFSPYYIRLFADADVMAGATCTCAYDWGGWCKHIVAVLLTCIHEPGKIKERPALEDLLSELDRGQLHALLLRLAARDLFSVDLVENDLSTLQDDSLRAVSGQVADSVPDRTLVDQESLRSRVRFILHSLDHMPQSEAYWHVGGVVDELEKVVEQAWSIIRDGDGLRALDILEVLTDELMAGWETLDDSDGEVGRFFYDVGQAWTEAILSADLTANERAGWGTRLAEWQQALDAYGIERALSAAVAAIEQGWDYVPLQRVLQGETLEEFVLTDEAPFFAENLIIGRLNVLERQGSEQEYLFLAKAGGQSELYTRMLVRLGRTREAVEFGLEKFLTTDEAMTLVRILRAQDEIGESMRVAEHGLTLRGDKALLAIWLRDMASDAGDLKRALAAAVIVLRSQPDMDSYLEARDLAGERWPQYRAEILDHLRHVDSFWVAGPVEIFLHEGLVADAIAVVDRSGDDALVSQVVEAALESHPEWVIQTCRKRAERIMDGGKSERYEYAFKWLAKARHAYQAAGREDDWQSYLEELLVLHRRKYRLVPMLKVLEER